MNIKTFLIYPFVIFAFSYSLPNFAQTMSGEEIIKRVDKNRIYEKIEYFGKMTIKKDKKIISKTMHAFAEGDKKAFIEFTNPEDRGTKYLKLDNELWIYFPDAEEPVKISGHMLRESMMGSDFSYEDALENEELIKRYYVNVVGDEIINKSDCYILELNAKDKKITYAKRKLWVDKEKFVVLKAQLFAVSGKLLKEAITEDIQKYGDRYFATKIIMTNKLQKNSSTTFEMTQINFSARIPDGIFSKRSLER